MEKKLSDIWLKASVLGSLWASIEIILGSFFHNLRLPFAGTLLAMIGVSLLIGFLQIWNEKGLIWRAGLVCALMKSISPSAIILGPMTGIFTEALLIELFIVLFGRNLVAYLIAGAAAVFSAMMHKIATLLIMYGFDIIVIVKNLYNFLVKKTGFTMFTAWELISFVSFLYVVLGMAAAYIGFYAGRKSRQRQLEKKSYLSDLQPRTNIFQNEEKTKYSVKLLFFHILSIALGLWVINYYNIYIALIWLAVYVAFSFIRYKSSVRHLKRWDFWLQLVLLTMLASVFFNGFQNGNWLDYNGLIVGLKMNMRATIVVVGFSVLSVELRNPLVKAVLYKRGFSQLYQSLSLAFAALPEVIANLAKPKQLIREPINSLIDTLLQANYLLLSFQNAAASTKREVLIITGERQEGKTTYLSELVSLLKERNVKFAGFIAPAIHEQDTRIGFHLLDLQTDTKKLICTVTPTEGWQQTGPYYFNPEGLQFGMQTLSRKRTENAHWLVIDEVGPMELENKGWAKTINSLQKNSNLPMIWVVRRHLVDKVQHKWHTFSYRVVDISKLSIRKLIETQKWK